MRRHARVYVVGPSADGSHKVGLATQPVRRLRAMQTHSSVRLTLCSETGALEHAAAVEAYAHWLLRDSRACGEWFRVTAEAARVAVVAAEEAVKSGLRAPSRVAGAGRPPIKRDKKVKKVTVWMHDDLTLRIIAIVGGQGMSAFVREACEAELKRRERKIGK